MILIPVKQVPDSWSEKSIASSTSRLDRERAELVLNDLDEFAIEAGLRLAEDHSIPTAVVTVGPAPAKEALLKALSMGVDEAFHIEDPLLAGSCFHQTSSAIAAIAKKIGATIIITGLESTDGKGSVIPAMVAAHLDWNVATALSQPRIENGKLIGSTIEPNREKGYSIELPCVVSVCENANEPRFPSFKGIMAAKKKQVTSISMQDLSGQGFDEFLTSATVVIESWEEAPSRTKGALISDSQDGAKTLLNVLREMRES